MKINYEERWLLIKHLIETWWKPLIPTDGVTQKELSETEKRLGITLPRAIAKWYQIAGNRTDLINHQDYFVPLKELNIRNNVLEVCIENQGVIYWGIKASDLDKTDPLVVATSNDYLSDVEEIGTFSYFILNMIAWTSTLFSTPTFKASGTINENTLASLNAHFVYLGFVHAWPENKSEMFCEKQGIVWLWDDVIEFYAKDETAFSYGMNIIDAVWSQSQRLQ